MILESRLAVLDGERVHYHFHRLVSQFILTRMRLGFPENDGWFGFSSLVYSCDTPVLDMLSWLER